MKKKKTLMGLLILGLVLVIVGTSYALWQLTLTQTGTNTITTGCFQLNLVDGSNGITLNEAIPITDDEGHNLDSYNFTITNTCSTEASYVINLETLSNGPKNLKEKYLKTSLISNDEEVFLSTLKPRFENLDKGIEESSKAFWLFEDTLAGNSSRTFDLRIWLDGNTLALDEVMNATYLGKITVIATFKEPLKMENMMISKHNVLESGEIDYESNNFSFCHDSHQIIFENKISVGSEFETIDVSKNKTNSVIAYVDRSDANNIVTHIQANGTILFPEDCSYLFAVSENLNAIVGLENVNTSYVTDMSYMFDGVNIDSINLDNFDVSNVVDMQCMFSSVDILNFSMKNWKISDKTVLDGLFNYVGIHERQIENIDLSGWDVSRVSTEYLFDDLIPCNLKSLNLSNWYVNPEAMQLVSNIRGFYLENLNLSNWSFTTIFDNVSFIIPCHKVTNLNLSNWDTSMIADIGRAFELAYNEESDFPGLTNLDLSGWDTTYVTSMNSMFTTFLDLVNLNISSFDTTNVEDLSYMFSNCSNLTNITYGPKFIYDASKNIEGMYDNSPANKPTDSSWNGVWE